MDGSAGALWLILMRVGQGVGGAMLFANSGAILTDAFPPNQRGLALGINSDRRDRGLVHRARARRRAGAGQWRLVFLVSVPVGLVATVWAYRSLRELATRQAGQIDWWGNATFAVGLVAVMVGITYGIQPYGGHTMGWTSPLVVSCRSAALRSSRCSCGSSARGGPDVPPRPVPDPRVHRRQRRDVARRRSAAAGCSSS